MDTLKHYLWYCVGLLIAIIFLWGGVNPVCVQASPPVLAFYYAWFDDNTWASGKPAAIPNPTYRSADAATIERHVMQAQNAGITALVQSWYGPQAENNQTETNFRMLLDSAAAHNFKAAVDVEVMGPFFADAGSVQAGLSALMGSHINHPAYFRYNGKPVIFFWRQQRFSVDTWASIRQAVDPNHNTLWIAEGTDLSYLDVFDGHHLYSIAWAGDPQAELSKWPPRIQKIEARTGTDKVWTATVMPGYNDYNLNRSDSFARNREDGNYYRQTWTAAISTNPDLIIITSFNEWLEGTQIEPDGNYGNFYLNLTRDLIAGTPAAAPSAPPPTEPSPAPLPVEPEATLAAPPDSTPAPLPADGTYSIKSGDTLLGIALTFDLDMAALIAINAPIDPTSLQIGQVIILPFTTTIAAPVNRDHLPAPKLPPRYSFFRQKNIPLNP